MSKSESTINNTKQKVKRIAIGDVKITDVEKKAIMDVLESNRMSEWRNVKEFERIFAEYIDRKHCIAVSSGTAAIIVGLLALINDARFPRVKKASKVITTSLTYVATANAIVLAGLEPVFIDVDKTTFSILPDKIEEHLENVKEIEEYSVILPVHLMGYPCDMDRINELATRFGLLVFEDAAQAHGTVYKGRKMGALSLLADFSFYLAHNIQVGEMGAIVTNDDKIADLVKALKTNGRACKCDLCTRDKGYCPSLGVYGEEDIDPRFLHTLIGANFKTTEFQAALGICQMKKAAQIVTRRSENVKFLNKHLKRYEDFLQLPLYSPDTSYLAYPIVIKDPRRICRKKLREQLEKNGIETRPLFGCIPTQQPAYAYLKGKNSFPQAEYLGRNALYIGCHQYLTNDDLAYIVDIFDKVLSKI